MKDIQERLAARLTDPGLLCTRAYVAGEWIEADDGATFEVTDPAGGGVICTVPDLSRAEVARAIDLPVDIVRGNAVGNQAPRGIAPALDIDRPGKPHRMAGGDGVRLHAANRSSCAGRGTSCSRSRSPSRAQ